MISSLGGEFRLRGSQGNSGDVDGSRRGLLRPRCRRWPRVTGAHRKLVGVVFCSVFPDDANCFDFDRGRVSPPSQVFR